jgi:methyltransferase-like protein
MDFVKNRLFRQTLLCHETLRPKRALGPALMHGLMAASRARSESGTVDLTPGEPVIFHQGGTRVKAESPETKAALACLMEQWPQAIEVDQLCAIALDRADAFVSAASIDDRRRALMEDLFKCFVSGLIQLHAYRPTCVALASHTPRANALAAFQAETQDLVVNAWHETVRLDVGGREVLRLSNGQRTRGEILEALVQRAKSGALVLQTRGETATEVDVMRTALSSTLDETLTSLARSALLVD